MKANEIVPIGLSNDNWYGYVERFIYENEVTWMEKTCATPFWTGLMLMEIDVRRGATGARKRHMLHERLYSSEGRIAYKGQLFSAPMDWRNIVEQIQASDLLASNTGKRDLLKEELKTMEKAEKLISLPVTGAVLAQRVRVVIAAGLVDLNRLLKQATVRRNVIVQLIRMHRGANHPDYQRDSMESIELRARELAPTDDPTIPAGILDIITRDDDDEPFVGVDKAATPAERTHSVQDLEKELQRARPQILVPQRDSDANKDVEGARANAFSQFSELALRTGSVLEKQFEPSYLPRVFNITLPWCVGGPDFPKQPSRRKAAGGPAISLDTWAALMASRCETQMRFDWDFNPGVSSLVFASKVNLSMCFIDRILYSESCARARFSAL